MRPLVRRFVERRIILPHDVPRFQRAVASAVRLRNSVVLELALVLLVYTLGLWFWNSRVAVDTATWFARPGGRWDLTPAGFWYVFVSIPIAQFILLRCAHHQPVQAIRIDRRQMFFSDVKHLLLEFRRSQDGMNR